MTFEIIDRDILGKIGKLKTKSGNIETPNLLPVINPSLTAMKLSDIKSIGCNAIIANSYILKKKFGDKIIESGIHNFLKFNDIIATDSGAYQILNYGNIDITFEEVAKFEEDINVDIAVILDIPTGWNTLRDRAEFSVNETLRRAKITLDLIKNKDILWVGPVQGGCYLDLISYSASQIGKMPFDIYALGSPTNVMENYLFDYLVDMILIAKKNLPLEKPFHLFGAGHPFMFSLVVALGCDLFDSAAYAIFARQEKYMTNYGTIKVKNLEYLPCSCNVCLKYNVKELKEMTHYEREKFLTEHNIQTCFKEIRVIKQAIKEGRLWELIEIRCRSHPKLFNGLKRLKKYTEFIVSQSHVSKKRGLFYFDSIDLMRPEMIHYRKKIQKWIPPQKKEILFLKPAPRTKPYHNSKEYKIMQDKLQNSIGEEFDKIEICFYTPPFGPIPLEIDDVYPLSQFEISTPFDKKTMKYTIDQIREYIENHQNSYKIIILETNTLFGEKLSKVCKKICKKLNLKFQKSSKNQILGKNALRLLGMKKKC